MISTGAYCDRSFKTTIQLTNHVNTHLGVKPFQVNFSTFSIDSSQDDVSKAIERRVHPLETHSNENRIQQVSLSLVYDNNDLF
jgi:hypothetical protein